MGEAARGYSWPPFEEGHTLSVRHGAFSDRLVTTKASEIRAELVEACPWLEAVDEPAIDRFIRAEARARMLHEYVMEVAESKGPGAVKPYLWQETARAEANAEKFGGELGLDPAGRGRIFRDHGWARRLADERNRQQLDALSAAGGALRARHKP